MPKFLVLHIKLQYSYLVENVFNKKTRFFNLINEFMMEVIKYCWHVKFWGNVFL